MVLGSDRAGSHPVASAIARPFVALRIPPNALTLVGGLLVFIPAYFAALGDYLLTGLLFGLVAIVDMVDGAVARAANRVTAFGGYLDSVVDRVSDAVILVGLGMGVTGAGWWPVIGAGLVGQYATSYARARAYQDGAPPPSTWRQFFERPERVLFLTAILLAQGFATRFDARPVPAPAWVASETTVLFWGLAAFGILALATAATRVLKVRGFVDQTKK